MYKASDFGILLRGADIVLLTPDGKARPMTPVEGLSLAGMLIAACTHQQPSACPAIDTATAHQGPGKGH